MCAIHFISPFLNCLQPDHNWLGFYSWLKNNSPNKSLHWDSLVHSSMHVCHIWNSNYFDWTAKSHGMSSFGQVQRVGTSFWCKWSWLWIQLEPFHWLGWALDQALCEISWWDKFQLILKFSFYRRAGRVYSPSKSHSHPWHLSQSESRHSFPIRAQSSRKRTVCFNLGKR